MGRGRGLALGLLAALIALAAAPGVPGVTALRLAGLDAYQWLRPRAYAPGPAVIVEIDDESLARHGRWPWPRSRLADLVLRIAEGRPAAIGLDIVMSEPDLLSPDDVDAVLRSVEPERAGRLGALLGGGARLGEVLGQAPVVLGFAGVHTRARRGPSPPPRTPVRVRGGEGGPFVYSYPGELRSIAALDGAATGWGLLNVDPASRVVRQLPLVAAVAGDLVPAFGLELLRVGHGGPALDVRVGSAGVERVVVGPRVVPTAPDGTVWLHYSRHEADRFVPAAEILDGTADVRPFGGALVLIGVTAIGLGDHHPTPVAARMAGIEIHAQLIENVEGGLLLERPAWAPWLEAGVLAVGGGLLIAAVPAWPVPVSALLGSALVAAVLGGGFAAYTWFRVLLDAVVPALGLAVVFAAVLGAGLAESRRHRRALARALRAERDAALRTAGELEAARRIQMGLLPDTRAVLAGDGRLAVFALLETARAVGGDLYDVFRLDRDRLFFLIGDVAGKGVPGSLFMAVGKALCKSTALRCHGDLGATMTEANADLARDNPEMLFVTAWSAVLDAATGDLTYCNAGHEPALLLTGDGGGVQPLAEGGGPPLCAMEDLAYQTAGRRLRPGQAVCLVTDGVTEAMNAGGEPYGRARLQAVLEALGPGATAAAVGEAIRADVARFTGGTEPSDDLAILVVQWLGPGGPVSAP